MGKRTYKGLLYFYVRPIYLHLHIIEMLMKCNTHGRYLSCVCVSYTENNNNKVSKHSRYYHVLTLLFFCCSLFVLEKVILSRLYRKGVIIKIKYNVIVILYRLYVSTSCYLVRIIDVFSGVFVCGFTLYLFHIGKVLILHSLARM